MTQRETDSTTLERTLGLRDLILLHNRRIGEKIFSEWRATMKRVLFVGQEPETVDFSDPALPPGI